MGNETRSLCREQETRKTRGSTVWIALLLLMIAGSASGGQKGIEGVRKGVRERERPRRWAVLIGVNRYDDEYGIGSLRHSSSDMKLLYKVLTGPGGGFKKDNVLLLVSDAEDRLKRPTFSNILRMVPRWLRDARPEDTVLVAFSGHGVEEDGKAYLLPTDAVRKHLTLSAVSLSLVREWMENCEAEQKILFIDACHAGAGKAPSQMSPQFVEDLKRGRGFVRLASCGPKQKSNEDDRLGHGVFTYYLAEGLTGKADANNDGRVDVDEAYDYSCRHVRKWGRVKGVEQDPLKSGTVQGRITLTYAVESDIGWDEIDTSDLVFKAKGFATPPDTVVLKDGKQVRGQIVQSTRYLTKVKTDSGIRTLQAGDIASIQKPVLTLVLKSGKRVQGRVAAKVGKKIMLKDGTGTSTFLAVDDIARTEVRRTQRPDQAQAEDSASVAELKKLGLKSALLVELGTDLDLRPVRRALERQFGEVKESDGRLFITRLGTGGGPGWVCADGKIAVGARGELLVQKQVAQLQLEWLALARAISKVQASVSEDKLDQMFQDGVEFFTPEADQYQRLVFKWRSRSGGKWVLSWPEARQSWASLTVLALGDADLNKYWTWVELNGKKENAGGTVKSWSLSRIPYGEHR